MRNPAIFLDPTNVMFLKLLLAMFLGGLIGTERAILARQSAGTRTFGLVSLGACLFIIISNYVASAYVGVLDIQPLYVPGAIVTGIGFLGGGLIIFRGDALHGITTAAGMWITAGIGMAVGFGMFSIGIFSTILVLIMFTGMYWLESMFKHWFNEHSQDASHHPQA
ncbi:MAG: MgtC/SapB family protein [Candidatus Pacebacteria bacterium]|nr:MgtC/SapB family protein [Candidatus Paceibacterota bacterium]